MTEEQYEILNRLLHRLARIIGDMVKDKRNYSSAMQKHIIQLELAREETLQLAEKINGEKNNNENMVGGDE